MPNSLNGSLKVTPQIKCDARWLEKSVENQQGKAQVRVIACFADFYEHCLKFISAKTRAAYKRHDAKGRESKKGRDLRKAKNQNLFIITIVVYAYEFTRTACATTRSHTQTHTH